MAEKVIILDQPKIGDRSQYNFVDGYSTSPPNYSESIGLPQNFDKFQETDLHTTAIGSKINEVAIESNMKFSGSSYIRIDNIKIDNAGVNYSVKSIRIKGFIFSEEAFVGESGGDTPIEANYSTLNNVLNGTGDKFCFYNKTFGRRSKKKGLGNISDMEGVEIVSNFGVDTGTDMSIGDLPGSGNFNTGSGTGNTFQLTENTPEIAEIINDVGNNPLYVAIWMRGDAKRWFGTDRRKKRIQVYRINNIDLFTNGLGKVTPITWENGTADNTRTGGGGGAGVEAAAFKITQFKMTINTLSGEPNTGIDQGLIDSYIGDILPPFDFYPTDVNTNLFLQISPFQQLNNSEPPNQNMIDTFMDYFPLTTFGVVSNTQENLLEEGLFSDLQSYYSFQSQEAIRASAPATITFNVNLTNPDNTTDSDFEDKSFIYFVIDWDDKNDEIKTIDDFLNTRPTNILELQELQRQGLYTTDLTKIQHTYITAGIKTVKFVTITYDEATNQLGRWKLVKAKFYLDIPITEYPDFGEVGGGDYTTIPWPFTTAIIGGTDENSKYKTSIRNTLASGKIGSTDVIDEKFLISDRDNDELGQSISNMDLEQVRYFNVGSYNLNTLLGVNTITEDGFRPYNHIIDSPNEIEDPLFKLINHNNYNTSNQWFGELTTMENRTGTDLYEQEQYDDNSKGIHIKYTASDVSGNTWTFFRYQRKDLNLKTFEEGGTEYTFKFEIKFNQFTPNAPSRYVFRAANRDNDYGTPLHNSDGFQRNETSFYRGNDGIYSNSDLTNKLGDYGEWITIERTRKLISNYESNRGGSLQQIDGYPNMEFLTDNWNVNFEPNIIGNTDPQYLATLPFPKYFEEFNITGDGGFNATDFAQWGNVGRPDIGMLLYYLYTGDLSLPNAGIEFFDYIYPAYVEEYVFNAQGFDFDIGQLNTGNVFPKASDEGETPANVEFYYNLESGEAVLDFDIRNPIMMETEVYEQIPDKSILNQDKIYWDGETNKYSEETSVGQIFINDNSDLNLKRSCKLELNTGNLTDNSIYDSRL